MDFQYDENLQNNDFFRQLQIDHGILLETAPHENWIICIPRTKVVSNENLNDPEYLLAHILIPNDELPETHFSNLIGKTVKLFDKKLYVSECESGWDTEVNILFEEIFYTKDFLKYKVWCIDNLLITAKQEGFKVKCDGDTNLYIINNFRDARNLIWNETKSKYILKKLESTVNNFIKTKLKRTGDYKIETLKNNTKLLFHQCLNIVKQNRMLNKKCKEEMYFLKNVEISVETYMMNLLYQFIFDAITMAAINESQTFNKLIKNLSDLHLSNFQIDPEFNTLIPYIKVELSKIGNYTTVIDKLGCLKKAMNAVTYYSNQNEIVTNVNKNLSIDDFLPILVFAIIKSGVTHWITNLIFLKEFTFTDIHNHSEGADSFLVATLEAAITFIQNQNVKKLKKITSNEIKRNTLEDLFKQIIDENDEYVTKYFQYAKNKLSSPEISELCHPLCVCVSCLSKLTEKIPDVNETDSNGLTAIHIAAMYGLPKILSFLISIDGDVNVKDENHWTPLHYTSARGYQNTLLLLLHASSNINAENFEKNTPLHLCCLNGNLGCVKAILYFADHMKIKVLINAKNNVGDTPLHLASKWGFMEIVETLLEYNADSYIANKMGQISIDLAHNSRVRHLLQNGFSSLNGNWGDKLEVQKSSSNLDDINKIDKIVHAISVGDKNLALYYLGLDNETLLQNLDDNHHHPLCSCNDCSCKVIQTDNCIQPSRRGNIEKFDIDTTNSLGLSALHAASYYGNTELVEILLKNKADITLKSNTGQTSLHLCCQNQKIKIIKILLNANNNILNIKDEKGDTAMHCAIKLGNIKLVEQLLIYKPNLNLKNNDNKRPIDIACIYMFMNIVSLLEKEDKRTNGF